MPSHRLLKVSDLSPDQLEVYGGVKTWLDRGAQTKQVVKLGGFAGSGKTALTSVLAHEMPAPLAFCAFTGKASSVLSRKLAASGIPTTNKPVVVDPDTRMKPYEPRPYCGTIHSLVYRPCSACMVEKQYPHGGPGCREGRVCTCPGEEEANPECAKHGVEAMKPAECQGCNPPPPKATGDCQRCRNDRYLRRDTLDRDYQLIVVDEASMVSDEIKDALLSYGIPVLAVGDHGQLPPVRGQGSLMKDLDFRLEKIHRQALNNPIIALSARIREKGDIDDSLEDGKHFTVIARRDLDAWITKRFKPARLALDPMTPEGIMGTVLVSWTNKMRCNLNGYVRECLGFEGEPPKRGEVVICLKNAAPVYNGMRGVLIGDAQKAGDAGGRAPKLKVSVDFVEDEQTAVNILVASGQFFNEKTIDYETAQKMGVSMAQLGQLYDFGYGLTCHKMQGSQADEVGMLVEPGMFRVMNQDDRTRWLYTAATRAANHLTVIRG
jgi:exodeoxyribonuclease-5